MLVLVLDQSFQFERLECCNVGARRCVLGIRESRVEGPEVVR
jgi:hypothetical protein